jgi:hypothetical protein
MRERTPSQTYDSESLNSFGPKPVVHDRAFDLRDPYKLNRQPPSLPLESVARDPCTFLRSHQTHTQRRLPPYALKPYQP